ncbi:hypothetical protein NL676_039396 [Syzygium grande]|nr:hypothetical protein NL676_039396 [Syzygium grande]
MILYSVRNASHISPFCNNLPLHPAAAPPLSPLDHASPRANRECNLPPRPAAAARCPGEVLVNNQPIDPKSFQRLSGYVPQDDALFPSLTVEETLMYSTLFRHHGGRKEAVAETGSALALHIVKMLKSMALYQGKTIILTIHQPGYRILELFDRVVLLSGGFVIHNGPLSLPEEKLRFAGLNIRCHVNVLDYAIDGIEGFGVEPHNHQHFLQGNAQDGNENEAPGTGIVWPYKGKEKLFLYPNSWFKEILILGQRFCRNIFRTKQLFATRVIQALVAGFVLGTIFLNVGDNLGELALQTRLGFFAFSLTFLLSSTTEGLPIYLQERRILTRETSRGAYRVSSYVVSNFIVFLPFLLMVGFLYSIPVYWLVGFRRSTDAFFYFTLVVWRKSQILDFHALHELPAVPVTASATRRLPGCFPAVLLACSSPSFLCRRLSPCPACSATCPAVAEHLARGRGPCRRSCRGLAHWLTVVPTARAEPVGAVGAAAPMIIVECGTRSAVSIEGDVYSFGVLILEIFIGKRPTNDMFENALNLHCFAKAALVDQVEKVIDPVLLQEIELEKRQTVASVGENKT